MTITVQTGYEAVENALLAWLETYSGVGAGKVRWVPFKGDRPAKPYGSLQVITDGVQFGTDAHQSAYNGATSRIDRVNYGPRQMTLQCQIFSDLPANSTAAGARRMLQNAISSLESQVVMGAFETAGLAFMRSETVRDVSEQQGQRWEGRAIVDIAVQYMSAVLDHGADPGGLQWIEDVEIPSEENTNLTINI